MADKPIPTIGKGVGLSIPQFTGQAADDIRTGGQSYDMSMGVSYSAKEKKARFYNRRSGQDN